MPKSKVMAVDNRKTLVAEMVCRGIPGNEIAKELGISQGRVSQIMSEVRSTWAARREVATQDHVEIQLSRLNEVYKKAEEAWQRSCEDGITTTTMRSSRKQDKDKSFNRRVKKADAELRVTSEITMRKGQAGDPAYLKVQTDVINTSLKLLNAFPKEEKGDTNIIVQQWPWHEMAIPVANSEVIDVTPSSEVEARIAEELNSIPPSNIDSNSNGNGHL